MATFSEQRNLFFFFLFFGKFPATIRFYANAKYDNTSRIMLSEMYYNNMYSEIMKVNMS